MKEIKLKGGLNVPLFGSVEKFIVEDLESKFIGILSEDYFGSSALASVLFQPIFISWLTLSSKLDVLLGTLRINSELPKRLSLTLV